MTPSTATSLDLSPFLQAHSVLTSLGNKVWPAFGTAPPPYLVQVGSEDLLLGNATPPAAVVPIPGLTFLGMPVYLQTGHLVPVPAATTWKVGETWCVAIPEREALQHAVDQSLGIEQVSITTTTYLRVLFHESFHAFQMTSTGGQPRNYSGISPARLPRHTGFSQENR
ncbi:MAG: hypothetical protein NTV33_13310 [Coprothermobacterota bacterium]|nr:hypothetical protein [Coprothermobacterota bacterium]